MKLQIFIVSTLLIIGCSQPTDVADPTKSHIPIGAIVQEYESVPGLVRATVVIDNKVIAEGDFLNDLHHGSWITYDPTDGKVKTIVTYLNGKKQGVELIFDTNGYVSEKSYYHDDQLSGEYILFKRKNIIEKKNYLGGKLHGLQQRFYTSGVLMEEKNYVNNVVDGAAKWFDQDGNLTIEYNYSMGELVEE